MDSQALAANSSSTHDVEEPEDSREGDGATSAAASDREGENNRLLQSEPQLVHREYPNKSTKGEYHHHYHRLRQKKFATQRSILKNSQDNNTTTTTPNEDQELLEAKKQMILRKRRLFSHYRQYEQWRRRQFSYDPCYMRALPPPTPLCGVDYPLHTSNPNAFRRRRQYRRQFSCAEGSREDSRDSRDSSHHTKCYSMAASDTIRSNSSTLNLATNSTAERPSVSWNIFCQNATSASFLFFHRSMFM